MSVQSCGQVSGTPNIVHSSDSVIFCGMAVRDWAVCLLALVPNAIMNSKFVLSRLALVVAVFQKNDVVHTASMA